MVKRVKKAKVGRPVGVSIKGNPVEFSSAAIYTAAEAAAILRRTESFIWRLCRLGRIVYQRDKLGYIISGRSLLAYAENRCLIEVDNGRETNSQ